MQQEELRLPAIEFRQGTNRHLYSFAIDGKSLPQVAAVSRVARSDEEAITGYQRPEAIAHIAEIRRYIESENPLMPNALVIAFDSRVRFEPEDEACSSTMSRSGTIVIPMSANGNPRPGFVVDGQQRLAALRDARVESFPIGVTAFITDEIEEQRTQFILVNATKALPKGLIYELLPSTEGRLPTILERKKFPAYLSERLNYDSDSPLRGMIRTATNGDGVMKDNSILRMLEHSLTDGALYRYRDSSTGTGDPEPMLDLLKNYWEAVESVFPEAWALPPRKSRLMHGVGVICMGLIMDAIADHYREDFPPTVDQYTTDLRAISDVCHWTDGYWDLGPENQRKWNELQNTSKDIQLLASFLLREYRRRVSRIAENGANLR